MGINQIIFHPVKQALLMQQAMATVFCLIAELTADLSKHLNSLMNIIKCTCMELDKCKRMLEDK